MDTTGNMRGVVPMLQVGNMAESLDYFLQVLGFALHETWPEGEAPRWARVSRDAVSFILTMDLGTSDRAYIAEKGNGVVFYVPCDDLRTLYAEMDERGALIVQEPVSFGDREQFSVADVNGYVLTFTSPFS
jgi:uncharacterized glyoxalase superfamily protein PhnB